MHLLHVHLAEVGAIAAFCSERLLVHAQGGARVASLE